MDRTEEAAAYLATKGDADALEICRAFLLDDGHLAGVLSRSQQQIARRAADGRGAQMSGDLVWSRAHVAMSSPAALRRVALRIRLFIAPETVASGFKTRTDVGA